MKRLNVLVAVLCCMALGSVAGCGDAEREEEQGSRSDATHGYGGLFRINIVRGDPNGLDPVLVDSKHADDIASQVFDKLIDLDDSLRVVPELAKSWTISDDGKSYTFILRNDVRFQDHEAFPDGKGRLMTAADVKYSLTRCCDPRTMTKAFWAFQGKVVGADAYYDAAGAGRPIDEVSGFRVIDDTTFTIELTSSYAPFLFVLVNSLGSVVPHEVVEKLGRDFARHPVGTGAFRFDHWTQLQEVTLVRNPDYWGRDDEGNPLPYLDSLQFSFMKDDDAQFTTFLRGGLDELFNIPTDQFEAVFDIETLKPTAEFEKYQVQTVPAMLTWYFGFNTRKAPFTDVNVRRAFNYAIDRTRLVRFVLKNSPYAPAIHGLTPPAFPGYPVDSIKGYDFDQEMARKLMSAAGYPNGQGFPAITLHIYDEPRLRRVAEALQEMLSRSLNITVEIKQMAFPQLIELAESGSIEFWGTRWYGDYPDPETYLNLLNGQLIPDDPSASSNPNSTRYDNPEYNALFNRAVETIDHLARMARYREAEQLAIDDAPILPLFYERHYRLLQPDVRGMKLDPMARYDLKSVWFDRPGISATPPASIAGR